MHRMWNKLSIVLAVLLISSYFFIVYLWISLDTTKDQLASTRVQLASTEVQLANTVSELDRTKIQLDNTQISLDATRTNLLDTEAQLDVAEDQLKKSKDENSQMLSQYADLRKQINVRLGSTPQDRQSFINPSNSSVSAKVQEITGGYSENVDEYWRDCERLYRWVVNNISYSYDSHMPVLPETPSGELTWQGGYWRMPEETLRDETGDCEDMAVLLASMLLSYNEGEYQIWVLRIHSIYPEPTGHLAVAFPVEGNRLTILDPAGNYYTSQYGSLSSESASVAVSRWLSHWNKDMPGAEIVTAFSEDSYHQFSSTAEFLAWLEE